MRWLLYKSVSTLFPLLSGPISPAAVEATAAVVCDVVTGVSSGTLAVVLAVEAAHGGRWGLDVHREVPSYMDYAPILS